jgi:hypothetical protein
VFIEPEHGEIIFICDARIQQLSIVKMRVTSVVKLTESGMVEVNLT